MNPGEDRKLDRILENQGKQQNQLDEQDRQLAELRRAVNGDPEGTGDEGMRVKVNRMDITFKTGRLLIYALAFLVATGIPFTAYVFNIVSKAGAAALVGPLVLGATCLWAGAWLGALLMSLYVAAILYPVRDLLWEAPADDGEA